MMVWATAVGQYLGKADFAGADLEADLDFSTWGRNLRAADPDRGAGDPLAVLVLSRVQRDVAGGTEAAYSELSGLALVGQPADRVDIVVAGFAGATLSTSLRADLTTALVSAGYTRADAATPPALRPSFTTYVALQNSWKDLG